MIAVFKKGDTVRSAPASSDVTIMGRVWEAVVWEVRECDLYEDGHVYETLGWWTGDSRQKKPTLRQLGAQHIVMNKEI